MSWKRRLQELALAGGAAATWAGCPDFGGPPCGNGNSDPCICGRPDKSPQDKLECDEKMACEAAGDVWYPDLAGPIDAGPLGPSCHAPVPDGGRPDGNLIVEPDAQQAPDAKP